MGSTSRCEERNSTSLKRSSKSREGSVKLKSGKKKSRPESFEAIVELEELKSQLESWMQNSGETEIARKAGLAIFVAAIGVASLLMGLFVVLIPATYAVGGFLLYRNKGWTFIQPGKGGARFIALNGVAWALYAVCLLLQLVNLGLHDPLLTFNSFMMGALSYVLMLGALFAYHPPNQKRGATEAVSVPSEEELKDESHYTTPTFNATLQHSVLMRTDEHSPSFFWWIFIGMQVSLVLSSFVVCLVGNLSKGSVLIRMLTTTLSMWTIAGSCATTHALGGKWRHIQSNYAAFQPGKGGAAYIALQVVGWLMFSLSMISGLAALGGQVQLIQGKTPKVPGMMAACGTLGLVAEVFILLSLFTYKDSPVFEEEDMNAFKKMVKDEEKGLNKFLFKFAKLQFKLLNMMFGPPNPEAVTRDPEQCDPDAHLGCEEKWAEATKHCQCTGKRYLIVGNGFVGKRLVNRLLERGETDIRVFDIVENNYWVGDDRVTFIRGDVTKMTDISSACEGVEVLYSTFAIIRFMDRLEHQVYLSYHINVTGTETLLAACKKQNVERLIVTSSSHATTDEHSEPRFDRDETAKFVTRETAHNHYGFTKAIADDLCLKADGSKLSNGNELQVVVVRPCSGVFGADDRLSFEKMMDMRAAPGVGARAVMDWVYVENVVLGHILAEQALWDEVEGVRGEAFCISNDDPLSMADFWYLTIKHIKLLPDRKMRKRLMVDFIWIPEWPLWIVAYVSELNQWLFKGKVSLGKDVDMLTPAMLATATMTYTYSSKKARRIGYYPVFTIDEAIQRSLNEYYAAHYGKQKTN